MKILHICLHWYVDGWGYQENLLPEYMLEDNHEVTIVTSTKLPRFVSKQDKVAISRQGKRYSNNGISIIRLNEFLSTSQYSFLVFGLFRIIRQETPDIIFHHDLNPTSLLICWLYCVFNPKTVFFVDNHTDKINQSTSKIWNRIMPQGLVRICSKIINNRVKLFYGVSPARCDYLKDVVHINSHKIKLLPLGADTKLADIIGNKSFLREQYNISPNSFLIVSGGKMSTDKGTDLLIDAYNEIKISYRNVVLVLFGSVSDNIIKTKIDKDPAIIFYNWCSRNQTFEILKMSDVACWPLLHTTLIEDAIASSVPIIVHYSGNTSHLIEKNGEYLYNGTKEELVEKLKNIIDNYHQYSVTAQSVSDKYSYQSISQSIIYDSTSDEY